jgi:hypothetical protein
MLEVNADFLADWCEMQKAELARLGYTLKPTDTAETTSLAFYSVQRRTISQKRRTVVQSRELSCPHEFRVGLNIVLKGAARGLDLTPHQSKGLLRAESTDALLNDWRIHHLHLGTSPDPRDPAFVHRTGPVLFAYVTDDTLYAIDVMEHGDWARQRMLEIVHRNWPSLIERYRLKGVVGLEMVPTDKDVKLLRSGHVQSMTQIDGVVYAPPGGGYATDGTSIEVVLQHQRAHRILSNIQDRVIKNVDALVERAREDLKCAMRPPFHFKLKLVSATQIEIVEINSKATFIFPTGRQLKGALRDNALP